MKRLFNAQVTNLAIVEKGIVGATLTFKVGDAPERKDDFPADFSQTISLHLKEDEPVVLGQMCTVTIESAPVKADEPLPPLKK